MYPLFYAKVFVKLIPLSSLAAKNIFVENKLLLGTNIRRNYNNTLKIQQKTATGLVSYTKELVRYLGEISCHDYILWNNQC